MSEFAVSSTMYQPGRLDERFFQAAAENEFEAVELPILPGHFKAYHTRNQARQESACALWLESGLRGIVISRCSTHPIWETFKRAREVILSNLDLTAELGATHLVIHSYIFADPDHIIVDEAGASASWVVTLQGT